MKATNLWTMAMAVLLTAGCSQNEITDISPDASPAVGFNVYTTTQTRGTVTDNNTGGTGIKNVTGFGVLAYYTDKSDWNNTGSFTPNFMYNQQVKWVTNAWTYTPLKYWSNTDDDKISFFAYAPYETYPLTGVSNGVTLSANTVTGAPTLRFSLLAKVEEMVDLVATNATNATHTTGANQAINITKRANAVAFKFDHVLTRVNFKAKLSAAAATDTYIFVTGMRLIGKPRHATTKLYGQATYKFADGTWDYRTTPPVGLVADYAIDNIMNMVSQSVTVPGYTTKGIRVISTTAGDPLLSTGEFLFLIPPTDNSGLIGADEAKVEIDYDIVTKDSKLSDKFSKSSTKAQVLLPIGTLKRNSAYNFLFTIGLDQVQLSATVTPWDVEADVAIPSVDASSAAAATVAAAITKLNTMRLNSNCNYFVVNIAGVPPTSVPLTPTDLSNFKGGDRIELKCSSTVSSSGNYTMSLWTSSKIGNSIILTKDY